ncbi:MAG: UDP-3-O-(3-hydroxymyristoyl)glucosamine N-acyltransferase, partial [Spirochaetota bacterium]|nr:UDP-3-O-(3-hydroxymyristoyl)glucosamine N-acyltransferase [Spirochaetota bacterium]
MTLRELASLIDGLVFGNDLIHINMISPIESPKEDSILYVEKEKCIDIALNSPAAAILIPKNIILPNTNKPFIQVKDGKLAFIKVLSCFNKQQIFIEGIHNSVIIGNNVSIGNRLSIMAYTVIGDNVIIEDDTIIYPHCYIASNVHIGKGCIIHSNVTIERGSILGKNNIIYSGAVIGSDGFGYHDAEDIRYKIPQIGIVQTGDNVEIGANSTIDRATLGVTFIDSNTKIDNLVQIAHNCKIGKNCYIASQT